MGLDTGMDRPLFLERPHRRSTAPRDSYWTQVPPTGFTRYVQETRLLDMRESRFGDPSHAPITDATIGESAGERLNRAAKSKRLRDGFAWAEGGQ